ILSSFPWYPYQLNKKLAYEVLKDAFTIGAAFLAPIAAEPYRVCRRVNILRDYPDDKIKIYP
ncbi:hypothetical protein KNR00_19165, partial [Acinetobacter baumannii]|nr:hypothetical protein [Acinetobacter baumannii]MCO9070030.1 hypothetical protein [Acinetobacter baumannii]MCO9073716.1 hypothetical protein [Acinetobacter baumannii]